MKEDYGDPVDVCDFDFSSPVFNFLLHFFFHVCVQRMAGTGPKRRGKMSCGEKNNNKNVRT